MQKIIIIMYINATMHMSIYHERCSRKLGKTTLISISLSVRVYLNFEVFGSVMVAAWLVQRSDESSSNRLGSTKHTKSA